VFPNPERAWAPPASTIAIDRSDVERRIGPVGAFEVLSGGLANANVRVGDRVLRIYRRDRSALAKEAALLGRPWKTFIVPAVLAAGRDFLVLEHVTHDPLEPTSAHGAAIGRALAEVHATSHRAHGFLGDDAEVREPFPDWFAALRDYATSCAHPIAPALSGRVCAFIAERERDYRLAAGEPVLLHADWKASNLHWSRARGLPLVLDWEFAWAAPALLDVGQLVRWHPPVAFQDAFAASYRESGGRLPEDWARRAAAFDLFNLCGLLERAEPGSRRAVDVIARIEETLAG
jgi:aminoglycoside phosphotransferase (APT) family kinase protein